MKASSEQTPDDIAVLCSRADVDIKAWADMNLNAAFQSPMSQQP